jgi:small subunit ribosomal protein S5
LSEEEFKRRNEDERDKEKVIQIRRVTKVVKGGKRMGFRAAVVVGDGASKVGIGVGKAAEVSAAIRKGVDAAKKCQIDVVRQGSTIPHESWGRLGASKVLLKPAPRGTGVIAGGAVRTILELAGISDVVAKSIGSPSAINTARATIEALSHLKKIDDEEAVRGKKLDVKFVQPASPAGREGI